MAEDSATAGHRFLVRDSAFGEFAVVWEATGPGRIVRVTLPGADMDEELRRRFPGARPGKARPADGLADDIAAFLEGEEVEPSMDSIAMDICGGFQRRVLLAERAIPRGRVSTYGLVAARAGSPGGARAAGRALATNPFPLVIPCHRAVRSDGSIGGYQGGARMKRALLEMEGVEFTVAGKVASAHFHYS